MRHPLSGIEPELIRHALHQTAAAKREAFPGLIATILDIFRRFYPPHILGVLAVWGLVAPASPEEGVAQNSMIKGLGQHHIELLQALLLTLPQSDWGEVPAQPEDIQKIIETVLDLAEAFHQRRYLAIHKEQNVEERTTIGLQERMRTHTQIVRNWGHFSQVREISEGLYRPLDEELRAHHGFGATDLIRVAHAQLSIIEARIAARFRLLKRLFRERKIPKLVRGFFRAELLLGDADAFIKSIPSNATHEMVRYRLLALADRGALQMYLVSVDELAHETGLNAGVVARVMACLTQHPGALQDRDPEHLFLDNPVWRAPVISISETNFCVLPMSLFSHIHEIVRGIAVAAGLKTVLGACRAKYLEEHTERLLRRALPGAQIVSNAKWRLGPAEYETDLIARLDRVVVVVECKSAALTPPALRGAPDRVKHHIRELVEHASEQSARLSELIAAMNAGNKEAAKILALIPLDFSSVEHVVRISVTLDDFSVICSAEKDLKEAGWIAKELALAPTLNLADLECVVDLLDRPGYFLHYFIERERLQKSLDVIGFEGDYLGLYLDTGFNIWEIEKGRPTLNIIGMSTAMDRYYSSRDIGYMMPKPSPKTTPYFKSLIEAIHERQFPGWTSIVIDLLSAAGYEEQKKLEKAFATLKVSVESHWREHGHNNAVLITPPPIRRTAVAFFVYPRRLAEGRAASAKKLAMQAFETREIFRCVVVARLLERWTDPYSFIYAARPGEQEPDTGEANFDTTDPLRPAA
jgi:Holliday junction resolvase